MFDNDRGRIERAFAAMQPILTESGPLPMVHLASEHFFDDVVFGRLVRGEALPYGGSARPPARPLAPALIEFGNGPFPVNVQHRFFDLRLRRRRAGSCSTPSATTRLWRDDECLTPFLDAGAHLLLDVCSLVGKYGRSAQRAAEKLLEEDAYEAACSDAHRPS